MSQFEKRPGLKFILDHRDYDGDECVVWPFSCCTPGYGTFMAHKVLHLAHRYMCQLVNGDPPSPDHEAAHSCGRGHEGCVHPKHLSWKTQSGNQLDRREHGTRNGTRGWFGKLTWQQVEEIRSLRGKKTQDEIAAMFGIGRRNVGAILANKTRHNEIQTPERRRIIAALRSSALPMKPAEVKRMADLSSGSASVHSMLTKLVRDGYAERVARGRYAARRS
jgi:hypothetical protein